MKRTLLLRLAGPMQSWGTQSRFSIRDTGLEPSKSGVFGLLCAALGAPRNDEETLRRLRESLVMGVRVDREGVMKKDFHTAKDVAIASGGKPKPTEISDRWYLADADFLVALESEDEAFLHKLNDALARPVWQIFLGRKSFIPSQPIRLHNAPLDMPLFESLGLAPWDTKRNEAMPNQLRIVVDAAVEMDSDIKQIEIRQDVPLSFAGRHFTIRRIKTGFIKTPRGGT